MVGLVESKLPRFSPPYIFGVPELQSLNLSGIYLVLFDRPSCVFSGQANQTWKEVRGRNYEEKNQRLHILSDLVFS